MRLLIISAMLLSLGLAGCVEPTGIASASIYVKDAPTDEFTEIHVVFTKVEVHFAGDDNEAEEEDDAMEGSDEEEDSDGNETDDDSTADTDSVADGDDSSWVTLFESNGTDVDLLAASGDASAFLGEADLAIGKYTQIRIHVESAYGIDLDGNTVDITTANTPLKVIKPFDVVEGQEAKITVDYDLDRSLVQQGPNGWRMTPVVGSVVVEHVDDEASGEDVASEGEIATA